MHVHFLRGSETNVEPSGTCQVRDVTPAVVVHGELGVLREGVERLVAAAADIGRVAIARGGRGRLPESL